MQATSSGVIELDLSDKSFARLAALVAQADGARATAEAVVNVAQQAVQTTQSRANEALQGLAEAAGADLPPLFEIRLEPKTLKVFITPKMIGPDGRVINVTAQQPELVPNGAAL
jgi:hypothetical protein